MVFSVILGTAIFGYAGWSLYRFVKKSRDGKCSHCSSKNSCSTNPCGK